MHLDTGSDALHCHQFCASGARTARDILNEPNPYRGALNGLLDSSQLWVDLRGCPSHPLIEGGVLEFGI